jgi:hypothetical protein
MDAGNVVIAIKAIDEASSVMQNIKTNVGLLGSTLSQMGGGLGAVGDIMQGFAAGGPAGAVLTFLGEMGKGLQQSVKDAGISEQTFKDLGIAVDKSGTAWDSVQDGTKTALTAMSRLTKYSDEELAQAMQRALTYGMSYDQAMAALGPTLDFAAARQLDLESASTVVGKAFMGSTELLKRYGVNTVEMGGKTATFSDVLAQLSDQFGGTAKRSAETYEGTQERLANAWEELSEKVGTILLPALTQMLDTMVPLVDSFGDWVDEVGKMPDVKGAVSGVADAFSQAVKDTGGLMKSFQDANDALVTFLNTLGVKTPEGFSAFSVVAQGFKLAWDMLVTVPLQITTGILEGLAGAFKGAADLIQGPIKQISDSITTFLDGVETAFQGFYDWLVGASLWTDLWDRVVSIATGGVGALLGALGTTFLDPIKDAFDAAALGIKTAWDACWQLSTTAISQLVTDVGKAFGGIKTTIDTALGGVKTVWDTVWNSLTSPGGLKGVIDGVTGLFAGIKGSIDTALSGIKGVWDAAWNSIASPAALPGVIDGVTELFGGIKGSIDTALGGIKTSWDTAWAAITAPGALSGIFDEIKGKFVQLNTDAGDALSKLKDDVVGKFGELAPGIQPAFDALIAANKASGDLMKGDWTAVVSDVETAFSKGWEAIQTSAQTIWDAMETASDTWIDGIKTKIGDAIGEVKTNWDTVWRGLDTFSKSIQDTVKTNVDMWIGAVLTKITDTLSTLKTNWDKGWNALTLIFDTVLPAIVKTLVDNLVTPVGDKINGLIKTVQDGWTATWTGLEGIFTSLTSGIQTTVSAVWDPLSSYLQTAFGNWGTWADDAMTSIQGAIDTGMVKVNKSLTDFMGVVQKGWTDFGTAFNTLMTGIATTVIGVVTGASGKLNELLDGMIRAAQTAQSTIAGILAGIAKSIGDTVNQAAGIGGDLGKQIKDGLDAAGKTITNFWDWLTGHSLWPDMLDLMVSQTQAGMSEVKASFEKGLAGVVLNAPTIPELTAAMNITRPESASADRTGVSPAATPQTINIPITTSLQVDGATFTRVIERRLIANRQLSAWRSA